MSTIITICDTCKRKDWNADEQKSTHGEQLYQLVLQAKNPNSELTVKNHSCLMGCDFACNVTIQAHGKISYVIGEFEPSEQAADAIVDFAIKYSQSETGQVPYKTWPEGVKGHFRARVFPQT